LILTSSSGFAFDMTDDLSCLPLVFNEHTLIQGNNCIGFMNRKFFILFLYYATFSCTVVSVVAPSGILRAINDIEEDQSFSGIVWLASTLFGYLLCLLHALVLAIFAGFHTFLVLRNRTTIEHSDPCGDDLYRFDRGALRNWRAVFGSRPFLWFVPVALGREGDGVRWRNIDDIF
jgi:palmitoyltransferase ZDHHC2/15/20